MTFFPFFKAKCTIIIFFIVLLAKDISLYAQNPATFIDRIELKSDTLVYRWPQTRLYGTKDDNLIFPVTRNNQVFEISLWPVESSMSFQLFTSNDFEIIDSLVKLGSYYRFKIRFRDIINTEFLKLSFTVSQNNATHFIDIPLLPYLQTHASLIVKDNELFIGEEKVFEISCNEPDNVITNNEWITGNEIDYKLSRSNTGLLLHVVPNILGRVELSFSLKLRKPVLNEKLRLVTALPEKKQFFYIKSSRLQYLNFDQKEITLDENTKIEGIEVQIEDSRLIQMLKTYRIENQEEPGGALMAEIFTRRRMGNNKVLCTLRPYNFHHISQGYLYIKDGDEAKFISNFSISPATTIEKISILQEGQDWRETNRIYPGQTIEVKLEGKGFTKANFHFEELKDIVADTITRSESVARFKIKVPVTISKKSINIYNYNKPTGKSLVINEYQEPHDFDYIYIDYGDIGKKVSGIRGPLLYNKTIKDVIFAFHNQDIDKEKLSGKQYISIDIRVTNKKGELVEMRTIDNIVVCPNDKSPRFQYYQKTDCFVGDLSLNKYLSRKTYDLDEWSKISMTIRNDKAKYGDKGFQRNVDLILKRSITFDVEVSFPAGLVTVSKQDDGKMGYGSLSGISMAIIAQFSFYHPDKIARYRPYKFGAGFLAFNAFNFADETSNRDMGIVALGSLYPTTRDTKLSFPLYFGGGYFLKAGKWFFLIGPGIRVKL